MGKISIIGHWRGRDDGGDWVAPEEGGGETPEPPVARDDTAFATAGGSAIVISPLANDTGEGLFVSSVSATTGSGTAVAIVNDTQIEYTPGPSAETDSFTYTIENDAGLTSDPATVTVTVTAAGAQSVTITANRTSGTAPAGVIFEASADGFGVDDPQRDLRYKWDFGDPLAETFTALDERVDATVNGRSLDWRNSNTAYTYRAAHSFFPKAAEFDGASSKTFSVTCTVHGRDGKVATSDPFQVTINNPDDVFSSNTVIVAPTGTSAETDAAYPSATVYDNFDDAYFATSGAGGRILIERGATVASGIGNFRDRARLHIGDCGDPNEPKPIFDLIAGGNSLTMRDGVDEYALFNVRLEGDWDRLTESSPTNTHQLNGISYVSVWSALGYDTYHGVDLDKINKVGFYVPGNADSQWAREIVVSNMRAYAWRDYFSLQAQVNKTAFCGVCAVVDPLSLQGDTRQKGQNANPFHEHGCYRITQPKPGSTFIFDAVQMSWNGGWTGENYYDYDGAPMNQSCLRWNPGGIENTAMNMSRTMVEGGQPALLENQQYTASAETSFHVVDKVIAICNSAAISSIALGTPTTKMTNVLAIAPWVKLSMAKTYDGLLSVDGSDAEGSHIMGCTMLNWVDPVVHGHTRTDPVDFTKWSPGSNHGKYSSIFHYPNGLTPNDLSAQLDLSHRLFAPMWPGLRWKDVDGHMGTPGAIIIDETLASPDTFNQYGTADDQASVVMPVPIEGQLTTTNAEAPIDDIFGEIRPGILSAGTPHQGCVEPSSVA